MTDNKGYRIWQWAVLLLVLCNVGLIITLWLKPQRVGPPQGGGGPRDQLIVSLKFTDEQIKKYDVLIDDHQHAMRKLREQGAELREHLFSGFGKGPVMDGVADSISAAIGNNQKSIELVTYHHFQQVRDLCTDQQKQEFDKIISGILKNMNGNPGGRRPPPPRDGGPEGRPDGPPNGDSGPPPGDAGSPPPPRNNDGQPPTTDGH